MRRLSGPSELPSVVETAVAPELDWRREPEPPRGPRLATVNPAAARKNVPVQPSLFPYRDDQKLISLAPPAPARHRSSAEGAHRSRRKAHEGQSAFDFDAPPPQNVLSHARDRNTHLAVAPIPLRAMAAMFDAGLAGAMTGLFLLTVRLTLGHLPAGNTAYAAYAAAAAAFFFLYKLLYCFYGQPTFGLQGARLRVVTFEGARPSRSQLKIRLFAGCISVAGAGMGLLWPLADQDKLSWHDHISQTFLTCDSE
jgi:uncharacterized RDD family membrane protein YckC